ncbi:MAG TPA: hypothetical protein VHY79_02600 [Rhizomicrobium sp.]|jgi:hypothetical protein|nr:hypothetical protein [Rhizomicrobium sp.]
MRAVLVIGCFAISWVSAYFIEPYVAANSNALLIMETVFTVFAGFLVAIIAVVGDPALIPDGSWRTAEVRRDKIEGSLINHMWLFVLYLLAIGLIFVGVVIREIPTRIIPNLVKIWINRTYLFVGIASFIFTFGLARSLFKLQVARIEAEITKRRKAAGIPD